ncbi:hypothetical protein M1L60_33570 [Actinoplanes sp. TRM 88003]|uniref:Lipoprotein n=1 Tax=Paractinoplanes aksuensis TaxID=2939490 RepID=A0ABT1DXB9_9ACTN|nr:hypothetical protein [Actinoplanes aksuensis]MCO8275525.1 hypothetical protein [Actinoplanes aksuensis]
MNKKSLMACALAATGAVLLSACSSGDSYDAVGPAPALTTPASAVPAADNLGGLAALTSGTASSNKAEPETGDWALPNGGAPRTAQSEKAARWVQITRSRAGELDPVLVNGARLTLYRFDKDSASPSRATCNGECAQTWPPVLVKPGGKIFIAGVKRSAVGVVRRDDGKLQVTVKGWPVYRFAKDTRPGQTKGQGVGGTWFGITQDGTKAGVRDEDDGEQVPDINNGDAGSRRTATFVTLFDERDFLGSSQGVSGSGCVDLSRPMTAGSLSTDGTAKLWSQPNCKGTSKVIDADVNDLSDDLGFDDRIASIFFG